VCGAGEWRAAHAEWCEGLRAKLLATLDDSHGTRYRYRHGCRCRECRAVTAAEARYRYHRDKARTR
jgi:hypothetical protein